MKRSWRAILVGFLIFPLTTPADACSRVLWADSGRGVLVGRNMDWFGETGTNIWVLPRGMKRNGLSEKNPLTWTSRYGSLALTGHDLATVDGVNEKGLAVHALYLPETQCGTRNEKLPGLSVSMWTQFYLDQFASVADAVKAIKDEPYQLEMTDDPKSGFPLTLHLALNDATGDSAILEVIDGEFKVYHSKEYTVMTNQPTFDKQLESLRQYRGFGGDKKLPGTHEPSDRFTRAAYYSKNLPKQKTDREAVAALMSVMRNVSAPFGEPDPERPNVATTVWRTVTDLTNRVLFFDCVFSAQVFWVDTRKLDFAEGSPVMKLTVVNNFDLMGEVSGKFENAEMFSFLPPRK